MNRELATLYPAHLDMVRSVHDRVLSETEYDGVIIAGGGQRMIFLDDMPYPFKANPHLKWWAPVVDNPHCYLIYTPGAKPRLIYWQPADYWHKTASYPTDFWVEHFDVHVIAEQSQARGAMPDDVSRYAFISEDEDPAFAVSAVNPRGLLDRIDFARAWKTEYEIECMRRANESGARGHVAAERAFREGASEFEIHVDYLRASRHMEHELPYGNIIALNEHAAILHYQVPERMSPESRHSFLIDAGGQFNGYASDITRTWSGGDAGFTELVERMDEAQRQICSMVRPGRDYREVHFFAHRKVGEILSDMKFTTMSADGAYDSGLTRTFLPHGVGHYIGLQTHDVGGFLADDTGKTIAKPEGHPFLRLTRTAEERQVFTIEPGLYFIDMLLADLKQTDLASDVNWERVDAFRKFGGVRIEDDIVVRAEGHENLTRNAFKQIQKG